MQNISNVAISKDSKGNILDVRIVFGSHYFVYIYEENDRGMFDLGATHHFMINPQSLHS